MEVQLVLTGLIVGLAALYLARRSWRTWSGRRAGCGKGCGDGCAAPKEETPATFIPSSQLTLRSRQGNGPG